MENTSGPNKRRKNVLTGSATLKRRDDKPVSTNGPVGKKDGYQGRKTQNSAKEGNRGLLDVLLSGAQSQSSNNSSNGGSSVTGGLLSALLGGKSSKIILLILVIVGVYFLIKCATNGNCSVLGMGAQDDSSNLLASNYLSQSYDVTDSYADEAVVASTSLNEVNTAVSNKARDRYTTIRGKGSDVVTVMVYICGSDLESEHGMATADLNEMLHADLNDDHVNVIVETGGAKKWNNSVIDKNTNQRYRVRNKGLEPLDKDVGNRSMVDYNTLASFIQFCAKNYPADRYMLIMWDHGGGAITGYGYDQKASGSMTLDKIYKALEKGGVKFDFIGFDACLMATLETAIVTEPFADYLIASEEAEPGTGWYYTTWLTKLSENPSIKTVELSKTLIDDFTNVSKKNYPGCNTTLSIVDLAEFAGTVPDAFAAFSSEIGDRLDNSDYKTVANARADAREFGVSAKVNHIDLIDFASKIGSKKANALASALAGCVKYNRTSVSMKNSNGVSVYFPYSSFKSMNSAVSLYNSIGVSGEYSRCIKSFASLAAGGQIATGGTSSSPYGSLFGDYSGSTISSSGDVLTTLLGSYLGGSGETDTLGSLLGGASSLFGGSTSSSSSVVDLLGGILGGRSANWFETDRALDNAEYYTLNSLTVQDMIPVEKENGEYVLELSPEQWDLVTSVKINVFAKEGDHYVDLGTDNADVIDANNEGMLDEDGNLRIKFDGTWLTIGGQPVMYYFTDSVEDGGNWAEYGYIPIFLNGDRENRYELLIAFDNTTPERENGYIAGVQPAYDDSVTETVANVTKLNPGDTIDFIFDCYNPDGSYNGSYLYGERIVYGDDLVIGYMKIDNVESFEVSYCLTDIYGNEFWTEAKPF